jgi:hypothetical protein
MDYRLAIVALLLAAITIQFLSTRNGESHARLAALEARTELLETQLAQLEKRLQSDEPATSANAASSNERTVDWRLGSGLDGMPLVVAEKTFDQRRARVDVLLQIKGALSDAADWPRQPGQDVPIRLTARDVTGTVVLDRSMTLLRGASQEPGAYLHLITEFPEQTVHRVSVIDLRPVVAAAP